MKLTTKGRYAVMALADLAKFHDGNPVSLRDISLRQGISLLYLEQIFSKLKKDNIVKSIRGVNGGYVLKSRPDEIKLATIFSAVNEEVNSNVIGYFDHLKFLVDQKKIRGIKTPILSFFLQMSSD